MPAYASTRLIDRRAFVAAAGAGFAAAMAPGAALALSRADAVFASAYRDRSGAYGIALLSEDGAVLQRYELPARGHDLVRRPGGGALVIFARRPGTFAAAFDLSRHTAPLVIAAPDGRHFYGHGAFSADGRLLYASENDFEAGRGAIGVYDATDSYRRLGAFDSHGVGPHDIALSGDGRTLAVANGGIETHPDHPRAKLNLATMRPNLAFIDCATGDLIARHELPAAMHKLSIRHLALQRDGTVWFACQNEGDITTPVALIGRASPTSGAFALLDLPVPDMKDLRGYTGSIAANPVTGHVAVTSPRGGVALEIDPAGPRVVRRLYGADICGVAPSGPHFAYSSGMGRFAQRSHDLGFDNHAMRL